MAELVIGLCGSKGSGKSTIASYLKAHHNATIIKFADPLKDMMRAFGLTSDQIDGPLKEEPCELLGGKTPRHAMQTLGTEWGRDLIAEDVWVDAWMSKVKATEGVVVCDDVRFPNEVKAIDVAWGVSVWVERDSIYEPGDEHPSETSLSFSYCDFTLDNTRKISLVAKELLDDAWVLRNLQRIG